MNQTIHIQGEKPEEVPNPSKHPRFLEERPTLFAPLQIEAYQHVMARRSCALVAPTSSGKTLAVAAPLFELQRPTIFVLPFRSLIMDQSNELPRIAAWFGIDQSRFGIIQGGVDQRGISNVIESCDYILMTPDKLVSLLITGRAGNAAALSIFTRFDFVFDEIHVFNGMMLTSLRYFLRSVKLWQKKRRRKSAFYFLSATFPPEVWDMLQAEIGLEETDRIEGVSYTGDITLQIKPAKETNIEAIVEEIHNLEIETNMVGIFNSAYRAWAVCDELGGLLFIGQEKMREDKRRINFENFMDWPDENALIGSPAIEAGVDFIARNLVIEESNQDSFLQRFGRAARSGRKAFVLAFSDTLFHLQQKSKLKASYTRTDFLALLRDSVERTEPKQLFTGIAALPYYDFWKGSADFQMLPTDRKLCEELANNIHGKLLAFRSLTPYTHYESGESIGYKSLCRKELPILNNGKVRGAPNPEKYFMTRDRPHPVVAKELKRAKSESIDGGFILLSQMRFHYDDWNPTHWVLIEVRKRAAVDEFDDNIMIEIGGKYLGRNSDGSKGDWIVRFYDTDI